MFMRRHRPIGTSDEALAEAVRTGGSEAMGSLWDRYAHLLFGVAMKYLKEPERARDAVMQLFTDLPALLGRHDVERFRPWVHTVMRNRCLLMLRGERPTVAIDALPLADTDPEGASEAVLREAGLARLERAIEELNDEQRTCIRLFHFERMSYAHVADHTGQTIEQVRSHLQNGRRNLRLILQRHVDHR